MPVARRLRFEIFRRDNYTCRYCGAKAPDVRLQVDHVIPEALGGPDDPSNLVTACEACNGGKTSIPADAGVVEDVARDALRWKKAMEEAVRQWRLERQLIDDATEQFWESWDTWTYESTRRVVIEPGPDPVTDPLHLAWRNAPLTITLHDHCRPIAFEDGTLQVQVEQGHLRNAESSLNGTRMKVALGEAIGAAVTGYEIVPGFEGPIPRLSRATIETVTETNHIPLPAGWEDSIERFLSVGLPLDELLRFIPIAMGARVAHDQRWRYFCGIAWRSVTTLQEEARRIIEEEAGIR